MSCKECDDEVGHRLRIYPFRWGAADIALLGCRKHIGEAMAVLRAHQAATLIGDRAPTPQEREVGLALKPAARECLAEYAEEAEESGL